MPDTHKWWCICLVNRNREDFDKALKLTSYVSKLLNQKSMNDRINDIKHLKNSLEV